MDDHRRFVERRHAIRRVVQIAAIASLLALCALGAGGSGTAAGATGGGAPGSSGVSASAFSIAGSVTRLFPGATRLLVLTLKNRETATITITSVSTTVSNASRGCVAGNVKVTTFAGHLRLAAGKSGKVSVRVTMAHAAPNACKAVRFPFHYSGRATVA